MIGWEITFTNTSGGDLTDVDVSDTADSNVTLVEASETGCPFSSYDGDLPGPAYVPLSASGGTAAWDPLLTLPAGGSFTVTLCGVVSGAASPGDVVSNTAEVTYTLPSLAIETQDSTCAGTISFCGNGITDTSEGEECDDGADNGTSDSCCADNCLFKPDSTPCADTDGDACTTAGCDGAGACDQNHITTDCSGKCLTGVCDPGSGACEPIAGCCASDGDCPLDEKCTDHFCDLATNTCDSMPLPGCCDTDGDCPAKCDFCNLTTNMCEPIAGCCASDGDCPLDEKCTDHFCDLATNTCDSMPLPGCCDTDADCPAKCDFCNLATNMCEPIAGCCDSDDQCPPDPKCRDSFCDLASNTCQVSDKFPDCCTDDSQCLGKCDICDLVTNTCIKNVPNCCTMDAECGKCETCDLVTNTCDDVPNCCASDAQCPPGPKCFDSFCDLATNTCELSDKLPGCCTSDEQCSGDLKCVNNVCQPNVIPTVSEWGFIVVTLLLCVGLLVCFRRGPFTAEHGRP